ncbi:MAG: flagellar basal body rod protein FlgF [Pseudomonadota bacterium]
MDRALYVAMTGAAQTLRAQSVNHHNLANASTTGFKAELAVAGGVDVRGTGFGSRINAQSFIAGTDGSGGSLQATGGALDIALKPDRWLAVQAPDGSEAYTKAGDLTLDASGTLRTASGLAVLGDGGPITLPPATSVSIGGDGTVSLIPAGQAGAIASTAGKLKVIAATTAQLERSGNGLFSAKKGFVPEPASGAVLTTGALESSNVNVADAMVTMIELARNFELQTRAMKAADENAQQAASLVRMK